MTKAPNAFYQKLATALATILASIGLTAWYALSQTVEEVKETQIATGAQELNKRLGKVEETVTEIKEEQIKAAGRDDLILEKLDNVAEKIDKNQEAAENGP
jgi:outer membrane murein-binding lipoprotein Lpp